MILKSIKPLHFGPFAADTTLHLEPEVTVLTGPNDAGKSMALRAIEILCMESEIRSHEVNRDRAREFDGNWGDDPDIACTGVFSVTNSFRLRKANLEFSSGTSLTVLKQVTLGSMTLIDTHDANSTVKRNLPFKIPVTILRLPLATEVRQEVDLGKMNDSEKYLMQLGFGAAFSLDQHKSLDQITRSFRIDEAQNRLNEKLRQVIPPTLPLSFKLIEIGAQPELLGIGLIDEHRGYAPLGSRGAGVRRLLNVMGAILQINLDSGHTIILYDEPEISLHADAQHMLRRLLESLATHPNVQVVYTTHSPAMINSLRPHSVRVLRRERVKDKAVSVFDNNPCSKNFQLVRSSLGISPADSLLFAAITVIVEGPTEVQCIPLILKKLSDCGQLNAGELEQLLSQTHILDGEGSNCEYMCRLAKSQNAKPVMFLDGDKPGDVEALEEKHPNVPVVSLKLGTEFENLVPRAKYIQAIAEILEDPNGEITEEAFVKWVGKADLRPSIVFSKRIERWLRDVFDKPLYKSRVMRKAIELSDVSEIESEPFKRLFEAMKRVSGV